MIQGWKDLPPLNRVVGKMKNFFDKSARFRQVCQLLINNLSLIEGKFIGTKKNFATDINIIKEIKGDVKNQP